MKEWLKQNGFRPRYGPNDYEWVLPGTPVRVLVLGERLVALLLKDSASGPEYRLPVRPTRAAVRDVAKLFGVVIHADEGLSGTRDSRGIRVGLTGRPSLTLAPHHC